jgi:heptosyltransferase-3
MSTPSAPPLHVLIVRTDHLGDMLLTLPAAHAIKAAHPAWRVSVLASAANAEAARHHPDVDHVEVDPREAKGSGLRGVGGLACQLRSLGCDAAVVVHPTPRLALAVALAGVPIRIGSAYRAYSFLFNRRVRQHRRHPPWRHESRYNIDLLQPLGIEATPSTHVSWQVTAEEAAAVDSLLRERDLGAPFAVLHPGNAGSAMNWAANQYSELGRRLAARGMRVAITGGPAEAALTAEVAAAVGNGAHDLGGALTLPQLAAVLRRCLLYVGSATGPTHLAAAVGVPVLALYSPLRSSVPVRWRPLGPQVRLMQPAVDLVCPTCLGPQCPYYNCMHRHLSVDDVERAAHQVLEASFGITT